MHLSVLLRVHPTDTNRLSSLIAQERRSHAGTSPARWSRCALPSPAPPPALADLVFTSFPPSALATGDALEGLLPRYYKKPAEASLNLSALLLCCCNILLWSFPFFFFFFNFYLNNLLSFPGLFASRRVSGNWQGLGEPVGVEGAAGGGW